MKKIILCIVLLVSYFNFFAQDNTKTQLNIYRFGDFQIDGLHDISMSKDGNYIAYAGSLTANVLVQDANTKEAIAKIDCGSRVEEVLFTENYLFVGLLHNNIIKIYNIEDWSEEKSFEFEGDVLELKSKGNKVYATINAYGLAIIDLDDLSMRLIEGMNCTLGSWISPKTEYNLDFYSKGPFEISPDGKFVATSIPGYSLTVYDVENDKVDIYDTFPFTHSYNIGFSNDSKKLAIFASTMERGKNIGVVDVKTKKILNNYRLPINASVNNQSANLFWTTDNLTILLLGTGNSLYSVNLENYEVIEHKFDWDAYIFRSAFQKENKVYAVDLYGNFLTISLDDLTDVSRFNIGEFNNIKLDNNYPSDKILALSKDKEVSMFIDPVNQQTEFFFPYRDDCDGAVKTVLSSGKNVNLFDLSKNIYVADFKDGKFSNGKVINIEAPEVHYSYLKTFVLSSDNQYMFIPNIKGNQLYIVDLINGNTKVHQTKGKCGNLVINEDNSKLFVIEGSSIVAYSLNGNNLTEIKEYTNVNANYLIGQFQHIRLSPLFLANNYLYYFNNIENKLVKQDINSDTQFTYSTYSKEFDFVLNSNFDRVLLLNYNRYGFLLKNELEFSKISDIKGEVATLNQIGYDKTKDVFYISDGEIHEINPHTGDQTKVVVGVVGSISKVYKSGYLHYYQRGIPGENGLGFTSLWNMQYYDIDRQSQNIEMFGLIYDYFVDKNLDEAYFLCTGPEFIINFPKKAITPVEEIKNKTNITLYPNPTQGDVNINIKNSYKSAEISIINLVGKVLNKFQFKNNQPITFSISQKGFYIVKVIIDNKIIVKKILVK